MRKKIDMLMAFPTPTDESPTLLTPLSILYPGALFESQGKTVAYYDQRFDPPEMLDELIMDSKEIGVSSFTGTQAGHAARILKRAKQLNPSIITGVGGYHPRMVGEAEIIAEPFIDKAWMDQVYGEHLFPYNDRTKIHFQRTEMQYFTSRGCPFPCSFCALRSPWQPKPIKDLDRELKIMHNDLGFKSLLFADPNIGFGVWKNDEGKTQRMDRVKRIQDIGKIMRDIDVEWASSIRSPYLDPEMIDALAESKCYQLEIGCESGNDHFLKKVIRKGHGVESIKNAAKNVRGSGISIMYSFIAYMPREKPEMVGDTLDLIDWIVDTDPEARVSIYEYAPYPGSPMYDDAVAGVDGFPKFDPPTTMEGWAENRLMISPIYWIAGLNFRLDNTHKNFPGEDWKIIEPYYELAQTKWRERDLREFPCDEVEALILEQVEKRNLQGSKFLSEIGV